MQILSEIIYLKKFSSPSLTPEIELWPPNY